MILKAVQYGRRPIQGMRFGGRCSFGEGREQDTFLLADLAEPLSFHVLPCGRILGRKVGTVPHGISLHSICYSLGVNTQIYDVGICLSDHLNILSTWDMRSFR